MAFTEKCLPDVAQECDDVEGSRPLQVVDDDGTTVAFGVHEPRHLSTDGLDPALDGRGIVQGSFLGTARRIADGAGRAAEDRNGSVPGQLESAQHQERHEVAHLKAGRSWIEARVDRLGTTCQVRVQARAVRDLPHQTAAFKRS